MYQIQAYIVKSNQYIVDVESTLSWKQSSLQVTSKINYLQKAERNLYPVTPYTAFCWVSTLQYNRLVHQKQTLPSFWVEDHHYSLKWSDRGNCTLQQKAGRFVMSVTYAGLLQAPVHNLVNTILNVPPPVLVIVDREFQKGQGGCCISSRRLNTFLNHFPLRDIILKYPLYSAVCPNVLQTLQLCQPDNFFWRLILHTLCEKLSPCTFHLVLDCLTLAKGYDCSHLCPSWFYKLSQGQAFISFPPRKTVPPHEF